MLSCLFVCLFVLPRPLLSKQLPMAELLLRVVGREVPRQPSSKMWLMKSNLKVKVCHPLLRASCKWPAGSQFTGSKRNMVLLPLSLGWKKSFSGFKQIMVICNLNIHLNQQL